MSKACNIHKFLLTFYSYIIPTFSPRSYLRQAQVQPGVQRGKIKAKGRKEKQSFQGNLLLSYHQNRKQSYSVLFPLLQRQRKEDLATGAADDGQLQNGGDGDGDERGADGQVGDGARGGQDDANVDGDMELDEGDVFI